LYDLHSVSFGVSWSSDFFFFFGKKKKKLLRGVVMGIAPHVLSIIDTQRLSLRRAVCVCRLRGANGHYDQKMNFRLLLRSTAHVSLLPRGRGTAYGGRSLRA
jgi:hypothetical protein